MSTSHISALEGISPLPSVEQYLKDHRASLSKTEFDLLSEADGRLVDVGGRYEFKPEEPVLTLRLGGALARVKVGVGGAGGGGVRGEVTGFSSASRRRLMRLIASLERGARPIFVTMTYPDLFPESMDKWKRDIDVFGQRLARNSPGASFIWRIEFKERKSGARAGQTAPHFHLLVYGARYRELLQWVPGAWWEVVASGDADHLRVGTRVEHIYSWGGIMRYVGKYIAKEEDYPSGWQGRTWGVVGRKKLPWAVEVIIGLTPDQGTKLVRLGRNMIRARGRSFNHGLTWIVNAERVLDYLEFLVGFT